MCRWSPLHGLLTLAALHGELVMNRQSLSAEHIPNAHILPETFRTPSVASNYCMHGSRHDLAASGCSWRKTSPRAICSL